MSIRDDRSVDALDVFHSHGYSPSALDEAGEGADLITPIYKAK